MLEDKCVSYYNLFTHEESEVQNRQVLCPKLPGQRLTELPFVCKVLLLTIALLPSGLGSSKLPGGFRGEGFPGKGRGGHHRE